MEEVIVLASGASLRFWPLGRDRHKTLYPVGLGTTIFGATLDNLSRAGYKRIIVTARVGDVELMRKEIPEGAEVIFIVQNEAKGQGDAILRAARCLRGETFYLTTADKIYAGLLLDKLRHFFRPGLIFCDDVLIATKPTDQPSLYGIVRQTEGGAIHSVVEKPENWDKPEPRRIVSAYRLNKKFLRILDQTAQAEYNFEAALDEYAKRFLAWSVPVEDVPEVTLKYPWHLLTVNRELTKDIAHSVSSLARVEQGAIIVPPVYIADNAIVSGSAVIRGPVVIREGAIIGDHVLIRDHSHIGRNVVIGAGSEVKNSLICDGTKLHDAHALDSIIDEDCRLGAGTRVSNSRFDRQDVTSVVKGKKVSTGMRHFGVVIGKETHTATLANLMPGVKIGQNCRIGGSFAVMKDIPDNHIAYMDENGRVVVKPKNLTKL